MPHTQDTCSKFERSEMHISNKACRDYLLNDENALFDDDGNFSRVNMVMGMLAKLYEEDGGPKKVQTFLEEYDWKTKNRWNHSGPGMALSTQIRLHFDRQLTPGAVIQAAENIKP